MNPESASCSLPQATLSGISQGICVWDANRELAAWNERFVELHDLKADALRPGMSLAEAAQAVAALRESGGAANGLPTPLELISAALPFDVERVRDDGRVLRLHGEPMPNGYFVLSVSDVTADRLSEANYREQAARLSAILDHVVDGIVTINESGIIESWNKSAERLLGYEADEVLGRNVSLLMPEPHASAHDGYVRRYLATGERRSIGQRRELDAVHKDGHRVPIDLGISEMCLGKRRSFIGVIRDISDRREIERLKSGFVSTVSHELRTPLTSISGSLGLLAGGVTGELTPKARRLIDIAHANSERLVRLINDILDLEKAESGKLEFRFERQQLRGIVEQVVETMRAFADQYGVRLVMHPGAWDAQVLVDRDRLIQVLTNLVSNACKFSRAGGVVELEAREDIDSIQILVRDHGIGIPREFRPRMFQRFAQADSSDSRTKGGTGLGLSIAKTMLQRLGGNIRFDSEEGQGTTFYVSLPMHRPPVADHVRVFEWTGSEGKRVLVCEGDPDVASSLCELLRNAGMRAASVGTARAARSVLLGQRFDVAIVDLHLPDMEGIDLIAELREEPATRTLPMIVITAAPTAGPDADSLRVLHLADWLHKPIDPQRLLRSINAALHAPSKGRARVLHVEDDVALTMLVRELLSDDVDVIAAHSVLVAQQMLQQESFDLIILDVSLADDSGLNVLSALRRPQGGTPPVLLYSATEPSREISQRVQGALVKSRDSVDQLLRTVRALTRPHEGEIVNHTATSRGA
jgi:PAS domain S-box-containing protein